MPVACRLLLVFALSSFLTTPAFAIKQFFVQYSEKYADAADGYEGSIKEAKCYLCHQGRKSKKNTNSYGSALKELLSKKDKNDVEKIVAALETVAAQSSDPEAEDAPTFGELIAEGKLPGGDLEDLKKEPSS